MNGKSDIIKVKVKSSSNYFNPKGVTYKKSTKDLSVGFLSTSDKRKKSNLTYVYHGVPMKTVKTWMRQSSKGDPRSSGKYFYHKIRDSYPFTKHEE